MKIAREINPSAKLPSDKATRIWRYMDLWKFESLIQKSALYLCRLDKLQDRFEGTYSRQQILGMNNWLESKGYHSVVESEAQHRRLQRKQTFISSWCMGDCDLDLMWKAYCKNATAIAIQSTVESFEKIADAAIDDWPIDISMVKYVDHAGGEEIDTPSGVDVAICKDLHFTLDKEFRLIHWQNYSEPTPEEVYLPIDLNILVEKIVTHPQLLRSESEKLKELLKKSGLRDVILEASRDIRPVQE